MMKKTAKKKGKWFGKMAEKEQNQQQTQQEMEENPVQQEVETETQQTPLEQDSSEEYQKLQQENDDLKDKLLRQMAEFDNYKKRTVKEKDELYTYAKVNCVETILGVIDNFERALQTECSDENFKKGVEMIFNQFKDTLTKLGDEEIEAMNQPFDPQLHNAVNQVQDDNFGENTVCQVFQKGYKIGEKVIRHAMVVVANP